MSPATPPAPRRSLRGRLSSTLQAPVANSLQLDRDLKRRRPTPSFWAVFPLTLLASVSVAGVPAAVAAFRRAGAPHARRSAADELRPDIQKLLSEVRESLGKAEDPRAIQSATEAVRRVGQDGPAALELASKLAAEALTPAGSGRLETAKALFLLTLKLRETHAPGSEAVALAFHGLGALEHAHGNLKAARTYHEEALRIRERLGPGSLGVATSRFHLGLVALATPDLDSAREHHQRAIEILEKLAPTSLALASCYASLGSVAQTRNDLTAARTQLQRALTLLDAAAPRSLEAANILNNLGAVALAQGDLTAAKAYHSRALAVREEKAPDSLEVSASLNNLGEVARSQGDLDTAHALHLRALTIRERLSPNSLEVAASRNNLGVVAYTRGDLSAAERYYRSALDLQARIAPGSLEVAATLDNLGLVAFSQGDPDAALPQHASALEIRRRLAPETLLVATSFNNLGIASFARGDLVEAKKRHSDALRLYQRIAPDSLGMAAALTNLADVARVRGDLRAAESQYERALRIREAKAPGSLDVAASLTNLGSTAQTRGDLAAAGEYYRRALRIQEEKAPGSHDMAATLNNLGLLAAQNGDFTAAEACYREALRLERRLSPSSLSVAAALNNLGGLAREKQDLKTAAACYSESLDLRQKRAPGSLEVAGSLNNLGLLAEARHDPAAADRYHRRALKIRETKAPGSLDHAVSLNNLGRVAEARRDLRTAERLMSSAWRMVRKQGGSITGDEARRAFQERRVYLGSDLERVRLALGDVTGALRTVEEARAQALQQTLSERALERTADPAAMRAFREARAREHMTRTAQSLALAREQRAEQTLQQPETPSGGAAEAIRGRLEGSRQESEAAREGVIRARVATERAWERVKATSPRGALAEPLGFDRARAALRPGELFLAYSVGEARTQLYLLTGGRTSAIRSFVIPMGEAALQTRVSALSRSITDPGSDETRLRRYSREMASLLLPSEARRTLGASSRLILSPDGPLWDLPWAALVLPEYGDRKRSLGLEKRLLFTQSLSLHARAVRPSRDALSNVRGVLALGDCLFDPQSVALARRQTDRQVKLRPPSPLIDAGTLKLASRGPREVLRGELGEWKPLPATRPEAEAVAKLYGGRPITRLEATEAGVRRRLSRARIIHLATHGRYFSVDPLLSGLILTAPAPGEQVTPETDGVLEAAEILDPSLRVNADVVVLSACGTGRGKLERAEGLVGLTRCWQIAGARSLVASQWSVADTSTGRLMAAFHQGLKAGWPKDEAMRRAMRQLAAQAETAHPFYWAPFLVTGDPRPIQDGRTLQGK